MPPAPPAGLMWFRRDLRAHDNAALHDAVGRCGTLHCAFVFDTAILDPLPREDRRVEFIRDSVAELDATLRRLAGRPAAGLIVRTARAEDEIPQLARALGVGAVFANHDDEPAALARDARVRTALVRDRIAFQTPRDHAIFAPGEVLTQGGGPYSVFTPYKRAWLARLAPAHLAPRDTAGLEGVLGDRPDDHRRPVPTLAELGFRPTNLDELRLAGGTAAGTARLAAFLGRIDRYHLSREFPAEDGTSLLGVHLRFGTLSIRELVREAHWRAQAGSEGAATWLSELVWRDFYLQVLANFPHVADETGWGGNFRREYDAVRWEEGREAEALFAAWTEGRTGYPLVDAAIAQIRRTGFMHNRLRMVTASFLCKHLGIDWRRGERWFAEQLNDYDLAANNGGWQWAASTGCDAQPYFRIFNPVSQGLKFDPQGQFVRHYLPQLAAFEGESLHAPWTAGPLELSAAGVELGRDYPHPVVDHAEARGRALARYGAARAPR